MHDGLRKLKSIDLRNAYLIKYSKGGQYFFAVEKNTAKVQKAPKKGKRQSAAAAQEEVGPGNSQVTIQTISVFNAYTFEKIHQI